MTIAKIVSGAQTGADRGGLDAAMYCKLDYDGWIPKGRKAEDGAIPAIYENLQETKSASYPARTESNVVDSDATLVLTYGPPSGGSTLTVKLARKHKKPILAVDLDKPRREVVKAIVAWLQDFCPASCALNVAGSRESGAPGIQSEVLQVMVRVISEVNGKLFYPPHESNASRWILYEAKPGVVVHLSELANGHEPGHYVLLKHDKDTITLCPVGEDENGETCRTDDEFDLPARFCRLMKPTGLNVDYTAD